MYGITIALVGIGCAILSLSSWPTLIAFMAPVILRAFSLGLFIVALCSSVSQKANETNRGRGEGG